MRNVARLVSAAGLAAVLTACGGGGGGSDSTPPPPAPNPLYVRTSGQDTNSGADPDNALRTISKAASLARNNYTIYVGPGTYNEGVTTASVGVAPRGLQFIANVAGDKTGDNAGPVTLVSPGGNVAAGFNLFSSACGQTNSKGDCIRSSLIDGFTITGFADAGIVIKSGSNDFIIQNCIVFDNPGDGIRVQASNRVLVFNNLAHGNGGDGVGIHQGSHDAQVISNTVANNGGYGLVVGNSDSASPGALVHNNIVQNNEADFSIKVFTSPYRSDLGYDGDYNLVFPATYLPTEPTSIRGVNDVNNEVNFTADFHVPATGPTINAGGPLNLPNSQTTILRARTTDGKNLDKGLFDLGFHFLR